MLKENNLSYESDVLIGYLRDFFTFSNNFNDYCLTSTATSTLVVGNFYTAIAEDGKRITR